MSYRLDDPGTGPISVAEARKRAQAPPIRGISEPLIFRPISGLPVITFLSRNTACGEGCTARTKHSRRLTRRIGRGNAQMKRRLLLREPIGVALEALRYE